MISELNRVTTAILILFAAVALSVTFWIVIQGKSLLAREDNARLVIEEQRINRGTIYDRDGEKLAYSAETETGIRRRIYPYPDAAGAVGYYSLKYGEAGIEAAYNEQLRGDNVQSDLEQEWAKTLHRAQQGGDVRSTLDLDVQLAVDEAMGTQRGAVIVVEVPSGRILAMVSHPKYDPNQVEDDWDRLTRDEDTSPLLNRAIAGLYQPGSALQTVMLVTMLSAYPDLTTAAGYVLNEELPDAQETVELNGLELTCQDQTPDQRLTLAEAYAYGCPAPFADALLKGAVQPGDLWQRLDVFGLLDRPKLEGFETQAGIPPRPLTSSSSSDQLLSTAVGQGDLTVTPLQMVQVVAAIANQGNAVPLHVVDAVRPPDATQWQDVNISAFQPALLRTDVAEAVRLTMLQAAATSPAVRQAQPGKLVLYGHSGLAYAGPRPTPYAWFVGFVDQSVAEQQAAIAVVVVLENEDDPGAAATVARAAFMAAAGE